MPFSLIHSPTTVFHDFVRDFCQMRVYGAGLLLALLCLSVMSVDQDAISTSATSVFTWTYDVMPWTDDLNPSLDSAELSKVDVALDGDAHSGR